MGNVEQVDVNERGQRFNTREVIVRQIQHLQKPERMDVDGRGDLIARNVELVHSTVEISQGKSLDQISADIENGAMWD